MAPSSLTPCDASAPCHAEDGSENSLFRNDTCLKLPTEDVQAEESEDGEEDPFQDLNGDSELED